MSERDNDSAKSSGTGRWIGSEYNDELLEGHSYDGIQEYDNPMPLWWTLLFLGTTIFAFLYIAYFLPEYGPTKEKEYAMAKEEHDAKYAVNAEKTSGFPKLADLVAFAKQPANVETGKDVFMMYCLPCHTAEGTGLIGPNLTDKQWIHGGSLDSIYNTISNGVLEKGMVAWKEQLSVDEIMKVTAFVRSIQDTNKPGKEPQGEVSEATPLN